MIFATAVGCSQETGDNNLFNSFESSKSINIEPSSSNYNFFFYEVLTPVTFQTLGTVEYHYIEQTFSSVEISQNAMSAGASSVSWDDFTKAIIYMPQPENTLLTTTIHDCNNEYDIYGMTNIHVMGASILSGCQLTAHAPENNMRCE